MNIYVAVLRLIRVFLEQRQQLQQQQLLQPQPSTSPDILSALTESAKLDSGIYCCLYQSVNCSADTVTDIVKPVLPLIHSLHHDHNSNNLYFDPSSNIALLQKLNGDIMAGETISPHYLRRVKLVVPVFTDQERESVCTLTLKILNQLLQMLTQSANPIRENVLKFIQQLLEVLSELRLSTDQIEYIFDVMDRLMASLSEHCPFIANYENIVGIIVLSEWKWNHHSSLLCNNNNNNRNRNI